jgi:hypothetical protein
MGPEKSIEHKYKSQIMLPSDLKHPQIQIISKPNS